MRSIDSTNGPGLPRLALCVALALLGAGCGPGPIGGSDMALAPGVSLPRISGENVLSVTVNGSNCSPGSYSNKPCVSVTLCPAGADPAGLPNGSCQTINDILLDTGSYGLRVFKSVLTPTLLGGLTPVQDAQGRPIGDCANFMDGSEEWGPIEKASIVLGSEPAVVAPIQVIDAGFASAPSYCSSPAQGPSDAGFNGILGVGVFAQECGADCVASGSPGYYYACDSSGCGSGTALALDDQLTNPVSLLPVDNNGLVIELPEVPLGGAQYAEGYVVLGIGTRPDNQPNGVRTYAADPYFGEFTTLFEGTTYSGSFLDTGSDALFFNQNQNQNPPKTQANPLPLCSGSSSGQSGWYCPGSPEGFTALNESATGGSGIPSSFTIGDAEGLASSPNNVFQELAGFITPSSGDGSFDWGLPFHLGRSVYVGIEGRTSSLGKGPYWAF